jgi:hypothetical protein
MSKSSSTTAKQQQTDKRVALILQHFPEYVDGTCLCGFEIAHVDAWARHLAELLDVRDQAMGEIGVESGAVHALRQDVLHPMETLVERLRQGRPTNPDHPEHQPEN